MYISIKCGWVFWSTFQSSQYTHRCTKIKFTNLLLLEVDEEEDEASTFIPTFTAAVALLMLTLILPLLLELGWEDTSAALLAS